MQMSANWFIKSCGDIGTGLLLLSAVFSIQRYPFQFELFIAGAIFFTVFAVRVLIEITRLDSSPLTKRLWIVVTLLAPILGAWVAYHVALKRYFTSMNNSR